MNISIPQFEICMGMRTIPLKKSYSNFVSCTSQNETELSSNVKPQCSAGTAYKIGYAQFQAMIQLYVSLNSEQR